MGSFAELGFLAIQFTKCGVPADLRLGPTAKSAAAERQIVSPTARKESGMGLCSRMFGRGGSDESDALPALEQFEELADRDSPLDAMEFMASLSGRYSAMLGPNGPLHSRFIACMEKLKRKADD